MASLTCVQLYLCHGLPAGSPFLSEHTLVLRTKSHRAIPGRHRYGSNQTDGITLGSSDPQGIQRGRCSEQVLPPPLSLAQVRFSWHWRVNRCEQVYRDLACQGWHRSWPSLTRDGNCHLLQAAHQNTLLPGTSIGSNQLVSGHHAIPADGQKGWGAAKAVPSWRGMKWRW